METTPHAATDDAATHDVATDEPRYLYRPYEGRMLGGVAAGLAGYLDVDVTLVRIVIVVLALVGGAGIPLYLAGWLLIPDEDSEVSVAEGLLHNVRNR